MIVLYEVYQSPHVRIEETSYLCILPSSTGPYQMQDGVIRKHSDCHEKIILKNDFLQLSDPRENTWDAASMRVAMSCYTRPTPPHLPSSLRRRAGPTGRPEYIKNNYRNQNPHKKTPKNSLKIVVPAAEKARL